MSRDPFSAEQRSEIMRAVGRRETSPEMTLRRALWHRGFRYRVHKRIADTKPDISFPSRRVAVFVDGCFWHGCPIHFTLPVTNADFWQRKIEGNRKRDRRNDETLVRDGWVVVRIWEHEIEQSIADAIGRIKSALDPGR
jgi:DNA mismatch endonuclease (patch repair protein)